MPGPPPKDPSLRQRRNKAATAAKLRSGPSGVEAPDLPELFDKDGNPEEWHPRTLSWWADVWSSPMATQFLEADHHALFLLAELENAFHRATSASGKLEMAKEIRLQRQAFGFTPGDRNKLQWTVGESVDEGERKPTKRPEGKAPQADGDPLLSLVKG